MFSKVNLETLYFSLDCYFIIKVKKKYCVKKIIEKYISLNEIFGNVFYGTKTALPLWLAIFLFNRNYILIKLPNWFNLKNLRSCKIIIKEIIFLEKNTYKTLCSLGNYYLEHFFIINANLRNIFKKDFYKINISIKQVKKFRIIKILNSLIIKNSTFLIIKNLTYSEISLIKNTLLNILCYLI
uniref:DNA replication complex GINS protein PSF2 n=1 Tax=Lotharella vacuolata TaxID=74820 RepID=A0A0H5BKD6_9EUKA|nr:DNA replication complex GINS protein PSF2 [Lotharella vacuolata]